MKKRLLACILILFGIILLSMDWKSSKMALYFPYKEIITNKDINNMHLEKSNLNKNTSTASKTDLRRNTNLITKTMTDMIEYPSKLLIRLMNMTVLPNEEKAQTRSLLFGRNFSYYESTQMLVSSQEHHQVTSEQNSVSLKKYKLDPLDTLRFIPHVDPSNVTKIIIVAYFRGGSTFIGDIIQQNGKTFYDFEPFQYISHSLRLDDEQASDVFSFLNDMFNCNYTKQKAYIDWVKQPIIKFLFIQNHFLWDACHGNPKTCYDPYFINEVCIRAPVHLMKLNRLKMRQLRSYLLSNNDTKTKVVYLVRDPRGIMSSRLSLNWCIKSNCSNVEVLCEEMADDIFFFEELQRVQPANFIKVSYEELSLNPEVETEKLYRFLQLPFSDSVKRFLTTHTRANDNKNPYSTRRNSSSRAFSWLERFSYKEVLNIQSKCSEVLFKLNYPFVTSPEELPNPNGKAFTIYVTKTPYDNIEQSSVKDL